MRKIVGIVCIFGLIACGSVKEEEKLTFASASSGSCHQDASSVCVNYSGSNHDSGDLFAFCESGEVDGEWFATVANTCSSEEVFAYCTFNGDQNDEFTVVYYESSDDLSWTEGRVREDCEGEGTVYHQGRPTGKLTIR